MGSLLVGLVLLGLAGAAWLLGERYLNPPPAIVLPTGERIFVKAVDYGTHHPAPARFPLEHRMPTSLRNWIGRALGVTTASFGPSFTTPDPCCVVWLRVVAPATPPATPWIATAWITVRVAEVGTHAEIEGLRGVDRDVALMPGMDRVPIQLTCWPRRGARARLVVQQRRPDGTFATLGTLPFANPLARNYPTWSADPLPLIRTNQGLECRIEGFLVGAGPNSGTSGLPGGETRFEYSRDRPGEAARGAVGLRLRDLHHPTNRWSIGGLTLADATGNECVASSHSTSRPSDESGRISFAWAPLLWDGEIWELRLEAKRDAASPFDPDEQVTLTPIPLPELDATNTVSVTRNAQGVELEILRLVRRAPLQDRSSWSSSDLTQVFVKARGLTNGLYVDLLQATDETGKRFVPTGTSKSVGSKNDPIELAFGFRDVPVEAKTLRLEFAVHRGLPFVFRVDPRVALTNATFGWQ